MTLRRRYLLLLALALLTGMIFHAAFSQISVRDSVTYVPAVERAFQNAMGQFKNHRYRTALEAFQGIVSMAETTHRTSGAYLMGAKSLYHLGEYELSVSLLRKFFNEFKKSEYSDDAAYTLGLDLYQLEQYRQSAEAFLTACEASGDSVLAARAERMLSIVASANLQPVDVQRLLGEAKHTRVEALLTIQLADKVLRSGDASEARTLLRGVLALPKPNPYFSEAQAALERIDRSGVLRIGVVLPLTFKSDQSSTRGVGQDLLDGIRVAVDEHNAEAMPKVNIEVRDSERDAGVAARQVSELTADDQILAIVGPVFSNEVFSSAGLAARKGIPLITPTATSVGIAAIGESVFQANPDFVARGRAMAQYAALTLGAQRFAVLASSDTVNKLIVDAFVREVNALGGQLVAVQWYAPGETDLRAELAVLRKRGMELTEPKVVNFGVKLRPVDLKNMVTWGVPQPVLDSLSAVGGVVDVTVLFGEAGARIADSMKIPTQRVKAKYDSLAYPVTGIDALFASIAGSEEIGIVASQLRYFNFQTQLLGTGNWNDPTELDQNRQYANGVIFATDAYWEEIDQQYQLFAREFKLKYSKDPSLNAMIGYDAMKLLLQAVRQGAIRREDVIGALNTGRVFRGVHAKISFNKGRVNSFLTLMQFKGRVIKKVGEIDVSRKAITGNE
ncbi:MAG: penicillin-binding protein activator [Ignavibacteriales bacterium]|nr:penicillin-binding protein activator [Ignavibacteriales bacterium]